jgi:hypothetical protein
MEPTTLSVPLTIPEAFQVLTSVKQRIAIFAAHRQSMGDDTPPLALMALRDLRRIEAKLEGQLYPPDPLADWTPGELQEAWGR